MGWRPLGKLQITKYKLQTNYKPQITNSKQKTKGSHGLPKDSFKRQTMTAFNQKLLQMLHGSRGTCFTFSRKESPWWPYVVISF